MSDDEQKSMGELCDEAEALGTATHVDRFGKVWKCRYLGSITLPEWQEGLHIPFPSAEEDGDA